MERTVPLRNFRFRLEIEVLLHRPPDRLAILPRQRSHGSSLPPSDAQGPPLRPGDHHPVRALVREAASTSTTSPLDRPVILLDDVIEVLASSNMNAPPRRMFSAKQPKGAVAGPMTVEGYLLWRTIRMRGEGLSEEGLGGSDAAVLTQ